MRKSWVSSLVASERLRASLSGTDWLVLSRAGKHRAIRIISDSIVQRKDVLVASSQRKVLQIQTCRTRARPKVRGVEALGRERDCFVALGRLQGHFAGADLEVHRAVRGAAGYVLPHAVAIGREVGESRRGVSFADLEIVVAG